MLDRPDPATLLNALAGFLAQEVRPQLSDKGLSFRTLIASGLLQTLALQEQGLEPARAAAAARLAALLEQPTSADLSALEAELVARLRAGDWASVATPDLLAHLRQTARDELAIANPRFDPDAEVPL